MVRNRINCLLSGLLLLSLPYATDQFFTASTSYRGDVRNQNEDRKSILGDMRTELLASVQSGDIVVVIGGTGGVGQLVCRKLLNYGAGAGTGSGSSRIQVRATSRNPAAPIHHDDDEVSTSEPRDSSATKVETVALNLISGSDDQLHAAIQDASALVISVGTTAFPTMKWANGNTPDAIDNLAVARIANAAARYQSIKKIVLVTSIGVERTREMPFAMLNLFGVLDAKRKGEDAIVSGAARGSYEYAIIRPGRLVGGPFTNLDIARLLQIQGGAENGVDVLNGDSLLGDCKRDACAEAIVQCLVQDDCSNLAFSIISNDQPAWSGQQWGLAFREMKSQLLAS